MEPRCAVCGETETVNLYMFNYGMCLCHRCMETAAQTFVHDSAERKLKETEKKREADAKKMAKSSEEIGKAIFVERDDQPESINDLKKALDKVKADLRTYKAMYRNRRGKSTNLMSEYKKLRNNLISVRDQRDSLIFRLADAQCDVNRYQKSCDELRDELRYELSRCKNRMGGLMIVASVSGLLIGLILGYLAR